jgi:hypothetical protein
MHRGVAPAGHLGGTQAALAGDEHAVGPHEYRLQQPMLVDAGGEPIDIAQVAAVALANTDLVDGKRIWLMGSDNILVTA